MTLLVDWNGDALTNNIFDETAAWSAFSKYVAVVVYAPIIHKLQDRAQPKRVDKRQSARMNKDYLPGGESMIYSKTHRAYVVVDGPCDTYVRRPFDDAWNLSNRLQPRHGGLEAQQLLCDRVEFESYYLKERLSAIR